MIQGGLVSAARGSTVVAAGHVACVHVNDRKRRRAEERRQAGKVGALPDITEGTLFFFFPGD